MFFTIKNNTQPHTLLGDTLLLYYLITKCSQKWGQGWFLVAEDKSCPHFVGAGFFAYFRLFGRTAFHVHVLRTDAFGIGTLVRQYPTTFLGYARSI